MRIMMQILQMRGNLTWQLDMKIQIRLEVALLNSIIWTEGADIQKLLRGASTFSKRTGTLNMKDTAA